jgi:transposase
MAFGVELGGYGHDGTSNTQEGSAASDGAMAIDNNLIERQIKPWKLGAKNWLFVGGELAGQRAAVVMSLVQSAELNGLDPWAYPRDVPARIYSHPSQRIEELLPHRRRPNAS